GPTLEPTDLYRRKSGEEITNQLYHFVDKGDREVSMRPELTPTLARMVSARHRDYRKPIRWFGIGPFFRFERQQRGRLREFYQWNCDIIGDDSPAADAELIALAIDVMRAFGFTEKEFVVRISDRSAWMTWLSESGLAEEEALQVLQVVDKLDPAKPEKSEELLKELGVSLEEVNAFMQRGEDASERMPAIRQNLAARGLEKYLRWDLGIVRGLAYYTSTVFEVFDIGKGMRAVAGGGRYDHLTEKIGGVDLPAVGFAMGDVVVGDLIRETEGSQVQLEDWLQDRMSVDAFVVVAAEERRSEALRCVQQLREAGLRVDYSFAARGVGKQFQAAEHAGAAVSIIVGNEYPQLKVKVMATRDEVEASSDDLIDRVRQFLS
ncbi:MAG: ATP phosphoribosyltransferase regulatory subunit, partial [Verrucomicrobiota bacterium]